jgi:hypothetical protein
MTEFITNRYGDMREVTQLSLDKIRVTGNSSFTRTATDEDGSLLMFDFEGGPAFSKKGKVKFFKTRYVIENIERVEEKHQDMHSVVLTVKLGKNHEKNR